MTLHYKATNHDDDAKRDIGMGEHSYFDVGIFNPCAPSKEPLQSAYSEEKKTISATCF